MKFDIYELVIVRNLFMPSIQKVLTITFSVNIIVCLSFFGRYFYLYRLWGGFELGERNLNFKNHIVLHLWKLI